MFMRLDMRQFRAKLAARHKRAAAHWAKARPTRWKPKAEFMVRTVYMEYWAFRRLANRATGGGPQTPPPSSSSPATVPHRGASRLVFRPKVAAADALIRQMSTVAIAACVCSLNFGG